MDAEDTEEPYSGETLFEHYYENVSDRSELSKRTVRTNILQDQSAFFSLITRLNVPILDRSSNQSGGQDHLFVGAGASFGVTRALLALPELHNHTINKTKGDTGKLPEALKTRRYVTKRIAPRISATVNEAQTLAAITNEVRILANRTLKDTNHLVRLLGVAWDEVPTYGRFWPRILLEAADYGTLGEFLAKCPDASDFSVKIQLLCGVAAGLQSLHQHGVAHCDLKLENVLVFRAEKTDDESLDYIYQAKICDFGFSVILTDYDKDSTFAERVGTEPWTSPELTFGSPVKITDLPKADIYSYGLLLARVFMEGGNPFERLSIEETREIKRERQDNSLVLHRHLTEAIFARVAYPKLQSLLIQKLLLVTLVQQPDARFPLHLIGEELVLLGLTLGGIQTEKDGTGSEDVNTSSQATPDSPNEARTEITKADSVLSFPNTLSYVIRGLKLSLLACLFLVNMIKGLASLGTKLVLRKALKWTVSRDSFSHPNTRNVFTG
ncbi:kinase-like domain-containing protein [Aspergillus pseudoustus]|uniref:Kinase-like domain-containing protein n=1 Tax=Aspergillus pseudoustus TaxID=1810923 RepID=A0ABR4IMV9_9EURO